ncbi:hypothetical protein XELAEV_18021196mg [Xenopus laevis]|uniref:Uncharacterized protein n=1 Tax=Xenopus laevis TaxID=8355 RepID=A0A974D929_XENLA|nr:hypothetical protein XELAEV_18021196mg [Xenopus laevis]
MRLVAKRLLRRGVALGRRGPSPRTCGVHNEQRNRGSEAISISIFSCLSGTFFQYLESHWHNIHTYGVDLN